MSLAKASGMAKCGILGAGSLNFKQKWVQKAIKYFDDIKSVKFFKINFLK
jgi:hypothetical protein